MKKSESSTMPFVKPQATAALRPATTPGAPGRLTPTTSTPGACSPTRYQSVGRLSARCMSFATMGFPEALRPGPTTQALDACTVLASARSVAASVGGVAAVISRSGSSG